MRGLSKMRAKDLSYERILSSMCTPPHPIALKAHQKFQETNLGDPGLFPGSADLEQQAVRMIAEMLGHPQACGYLSTGGTESNIQAIRAARNAHDFRDGNIVVPKSAHFSFDKIGDLLCLEIRKADLDRDLKVDVGSVEDLIDDKTVSIVGIAGTTEFGQVDPIDQLGKLALDSGIHLHVDAAFGGFVLPFLKGDWTSGQTASPPSPLTPTKWEWRRSPAAASSSGTPRIWSGSPPTPPTSLWQGPRP
jgi:tyrosine decarboxylase/aspartate 1-decarboxylase